MVEYNAIYIYIYIRCNGPGRHSIHSISITVTIGYS